jgi:hypothetical protein
MPRSCTDQPRADSAILILLSAQLNAVMSILIRLPSITVAQLLDRL